MRGDSNTLNSPMSESQINNAIKRLQAGSTDAPAELRRLALAPTCTQEQCSRITSAIAVVLDESNLQKSKTDERHPVLQALCLANLGHIVFKKRVLRPDSEMDAIIQTLRLHWNGLHQWVIYLKNAFVDQENVDLSFRILAKSCIIDFLGICDDTFLHDLFDRVVSSPGIVVTLFSLWRLETHDARFSLPPDSSPRPMFYLPAILDSWMCTFSQQEVWYWSEILSAFGGNTDALAVTALDHLRQDAARIPINYDLIVWDIHLLTTLSINDAIRSSFLNHHLMTVVTSVVCWMVGRYTATNTQYRRIAAKSISYGYWYIRSYVESTEGLPWVAQTVEAGLLPAMLSTEPWIKHLNGQHSEDWEPLFLLLGEILPKYSMYNTVLKPMIKRLKAVDMGGLTAKLKEDGLLFKAWSMFDAIVMRRVALYDSPGSSETHIESCQNPKCDKSGPPGSFKSCAGCLHVHYCSKECQVNDWKSGNHQKYCRDIQARRAAGLVSRLSKRDIRFIDRVIAQDISFFRDRIQSAATMSNLDPVVIEIDYTEVPLGVDIGTIHTVPPIRTCQCDVPVTHKWDHMVELAQKSASKKILVRAFLPGGTSSKVKLQCLPLKRFLGDQAPVKDEETISEFDETFDLLYSCAGQSFGIVDAAFPSGATRTTENLKETTSTEGSNPGKEGSDAD